MPSIMRLAIPIETLVFWQLPQTPEAVANSCASTSCYRAVENLSAVIAGLDPRLSGLNLA
jgi:hypothetical protein